MNAITLDELNQVGIVATVANGKLRLSAPVGRLTPDLRERITRQRDALLGELTRQQREATAALLALCEAQVGRQRMDAGLPPLEWGEPVAAYCEGCGPVLLWAGCPAVVKACPWCFRRKAGKPIARPHESNVDRWAREDAEQTDGPPCFRPKGGKT